MSLEGGQLKLEKQGGGSTAMEGRGTKQEGAKTTRGKEKEVPVHKKGEGMTNFVLLCLG